jgi:hypothetical protein
MSKKRHRTGSRLPDLGTEPGQDPGGLSGAAFASPAPGAHASDTHLPDARASDAGASDARASDAGRSPGASLSGPDPSGGAWASAVPGQDAVVRRTADGWRVGDDDLPDLTCAMVLADLLAAELPTEIQPAIPAAATPPPGVPQPDPAHVTARPADGSPADGRPARRRPASGRPAVEEEAHRLRTTVGQLEHALTARIRVEQAIGVLAERHRIRPRQAFEQLRSAARNRGRRVIDIAADVVASASNPLLQLPEELSRQRSAPRHTPRHSRRVLRSE